MIVALTGASGFLGHQTLLRLLKNPAISAIRASGRNFRPEQQVKDPRVHYIIGDLTTNTVVEALLQGATHVVHAAALSSVWGAYADFEKANVQATQLLIDASKREGIERFVFVSSPAMYFDFSDKLNVSETDPLPEPLINAYAKTKREAELRLQQSGLSYVIVRPRAIIGVGDSVIMPRLIRAYDEGKLKIIGKGRNVVDFSSVQNVAQAIELSLLAKPEQANEIYHISNGEEVNLWEAISSILVQLGRKAPTQKIPFWLAFRFAQLLEWKARFFQQNEPALTTYAVGVLSKSYTLDIRHAKEKLGFIPEVSTEQAMNEFVEWWLKEERN
ncbi:MAG: hypothetical protein RLZZ301_1809 [Bacteroidota bacterium]|jgi:nucleoside-diphosphate-sugar epimerase